ncbi:MAG: RsmB/NOP family class I SAM-dependent RNA methyltransferase [Candidatus Bathyarchaeota archaeon]|nr:RsmB/NOP family class I SAM-dependent RNA methyltransferase [Candidatus Bathyarchaeum tardum]WGM90544.1 MAG: RsmB/NOP family class I SAM-dependent RNA methyltransferase [Candidatus Bathyarchaeum tardum]
MSSKPFFVNRYKKLGWSYKKPNLKKAIRVNTINASNSKVTSRLKTRGIFIEKIPFLENGFWIEKSKFSIGATEEYLLGLYSIQEAAAQIPAMLFMDLTGKTVLDACASPGGKTVHLASLMNNTGLIVALELKQRKMFPLVNQLERSQVKNTAVYNLDAKKASTLNTEFDCVLLDLPCSGNPITDRDWFNKRTIDDVHRNARRQRQILTEATKVTKIGGEIVYATCSLEPEENEFNIDWALKNLPLKVEKINCYGEKGLTKVFDKKLDPSIKMAKRIWPYKTQGFFVCKLKREENQ